jgi:ABC-2 type transport system ATP-binding protein
LLGANGAGKTTLMRMVAGILTPSKGEVTFDGVEINALGEAYRDVFGYLPQTFGFYPAFNVIDYLEYIAVLKGLHKQAAKRKIDELLHTMGLSDVRKKAIRKLSGGMQRRVGIAQALLNDPEVLILDEPTSGLDPGERVYFRNILSEFAKERIVLISTHIVSDVEYIATQNAIMKDGRLIAVDKTENLLSMVSGMVFEGNIAAGELDHFTEGACVVNVRNEADSMVAVRYVAENALLPGSKAMEPRLEDLYLWIFRDTTAGRGNPS